MAARRAPRLDMDVAAAPVPTAGDGPDLGSGARGSPPEAVAAPAAAAAAAAVTEPRKPHGVKRHHHKHNLKHRYELQETLGKGTYGKVKRATERFSGRVVSGDPPPPGRVNGGADCAATLVETGWGGGLLQHPPRPIPLSPFIPRDSGVSLFSGNTC